MFTARNPLQILSFRTGPGMTFGYQFINYHQPLASKGETAEYYIFPRSVVMITGLGGGKDNITHELAIMLLLLLSLNVFAGARSATRGHRLCGIIYWDWDG